MIELKPYTEHEIKEFIVLIVWKYVGLEGFNSNNWARFILTWVHERARSLCLNAIANRTNAGKTEAQWREQVLDQIGWPKKYRGKFET